MNKFSFSVLVLGMGLWVGCSIKEPGAPSWQMDFTIPISDRIYGMEEIITTQDEVDSLGNWISDNSGVPILNFADSLDDNPVGDELRLDGFDDLIATYVGVRTVDSPGVQTTEFLITEIAPGLPPGETQPVPYFTFALPPKDLPPFSEYDWAYLQNGQITVTLTNNLMASVTNVTIDVYSKNPHLLLHHVVVPDTVKVGADVSLTSALPFDEEIDNCLEVQISGTCPGSTNPVPIDGSDALQVDVGLSTLGVTSARAHLSQQVFSEDTLLTIEDTDTLHSAEIREGYIDLTIINQTELFNNVAFILPGFTKDGEAFTQEISLAPRDSFTVNHVSLAGYHADRPQGDNKMQAFVSCTILDTDSSIYDTPDSMVIFDESNLVRTDFAISDLFFGSYDGFLDTTHHIPIEQEAEILEDIPSGINALEVETASANMILRNTIGYPVTVHLTLVAYRGGGVILSMALPPLPVPPMIAGTPGILDTTLAGFEDMVNALPDSILPTGYSSVAGNGAATDAQYVDGYYHIYSPCYFSLGASNLEPDRVTFEEEVADEISEIEVSLSLENHMPLSGYAMILMANDSLQFDLGAGAAVDTILQAPIPEALLAANGFVAEAGVSTATDYLEPDEMTAFQGASPGNPLYLQTQIFLYSTEGDTVRSYTSDYLKVAASAKLFINVDTGGGN